MLDLQIEGQRATSSNKHLQLDFGGIAKGYAIGLIAAYLQQQGYEHYLINAGGDLVTSGNKFGKAWRIAVLSRALNCLAGIASLPRVTTSAFIAKTITGSTT